MSAFIMKDRWCSCLLFRARPSQAGIRTDARRVVVFHPRPWMQPASDALVMMHIMWAHILAVLRACVHAGTGRKRTEGPQLRFVSRVQRRAAVIDRPGPSLGCPVTKTTLDLQTKISSANDDASTMLVVTPKGVVLNIVRGTKVCSASISGSL